jgi:hypothetical protein
MKTWHLCSYMNQDNHIQIIFLLDTLYIVSIQNDYYVEYVLPHVIHVGIHVT